MPLYLIVLVIIGLLSPWLVCSFADVVRHRRALSSTRPDYARINAIERALGFSQSNYTAFGIEPVDTAAVCIAETDKWLKTIEYELLPPIEKGILEQQKIITGAFAVPAPQKIHPIDALHPIDVVTPSEKDFAIFPITIPRLSPKEKRRKLEEIASSYQTPH